MTGAQSLSSKVLRVMGIFSGVQSIGILCSVVRAKLISLWIGPAGVGLFAIYNSVVDMIGAATQLNIRESAVRDISNTPAAHLPRMASVVRWWARHLGLLGALVMLLLSPAVSVISFGDTSHWWAFCILALAVGANAVTAGEQAMLQGTQSLRRLARATVSGSTLGTVLSIPLYYFLGRQSIVPSIVLFSICVLSSVTFSTDIKSRRESRSYNISQGRSFLRLGIFMTVSAVVTYAASYLFLSYLNHSGSEATTGFYQAGYTLVIRYTGIILSALAMEFFPRVSKVAGRRAMASSVVSHEIQLVLLALTPCLVVFTAGAQAAIFILYTPEFYAALPFVTIGIGAMVFRAISMCMAYVIIGRGDGKTYIFTEVTSALVGLTLNVTMYHFFGFAGLGVSYVIWYIVYALIIYIVYHSYGMRLSAGAVKTIVWSVVICGAAIALRLIAWWAALIVLPVALLFTIRGFRKI